MKITTTEWEDPSGSASGLRPWQSDDLVSRGFDPREAEQLSRRLPKTDWRVICAIRGDWKGRFHGLPPAAAVLGSISPRRLDRRPAERFAASGRDVLALIAIIEAFAYRRVLDPGRWPVDPDLRAWLKDDRLSDWQVYVHLCAGVTHAEYDDLATDPARRFVVEQLEVLAALRFPDFSTWQERCFMP